MSQLVKRRYITVANRRVHFRLAGAGPVVLLLHQSPQSSRSVMPLAEKLKSRYCVIAPDSPGFGLSAPLSAETTTIEAIAEALNEFTEALQLPPSTVIGVHTGAEIALEFGLRYPDKVNFLILDGLALFTEEESEDILRNYLPPFIPRWDGSHLTWLWARVREQVIFFPWYRKDSAARMNWDMSGAGHIHNWFMDFMYAGDHYRGGYGAAFRYRNSAAIQRVIPPAAALYRTGDVLEPHRRRLPELPDHVWAETIPPGPDTLDNRIIELLDERVSAKQADWHYRPAAVSVGPGPETDYIDVDERQIAVTRAGDPSGPLLMILHDLAGSATAVRELIAAAAAGHYVLCPDLPGHGESDSGAAARFSLGQAAGLLSRILAGTQRRDCRLLSLGASCVFIPLLIRNNPEMDLSAAMHNPLLPDATTRASFGKRFAPPIEPDDYGAFILKLWYALRDNRLFWPWYEPVAANIRRHTPSLDAGDVHQALFDALRCGDNYHLIWQAFFETDVIDDIKALPTALSITLSKTHPCPENVLALVPELSAAVCHESSDDGPEIIDAHFGAG